MAVEATTYDEIVKSLLKGPIAAILFVMKVDNRLKPSDRANITMFGTFPTSIPKAFVITHYGFKEAQKKARVVFKQELKSSLTQDDLITLVDLPVFIVDSNMYDEGDTMYNDLKEVAKYAGFHEENVQNFEDLRTFIRDTGNGREYKTELLKMASENPFRIKIEKEVEQVMAPIIKRAQLSLVTTIDSKILEDPTDEEFHSFLNSEKQKLYDSVNTSYENSTDIQPDFRQIVPLQSHKMFLSFKEEIIQSSDKKYINYVKSRQLKVLRTITLGLQKRISDKGMEIYDRENNPFHTILELNAFWENEQKTLSNQVNISDTEMIEIYNSAKEHVEQELDNFRRLIFGQPYISSTKARVLQWSSDSRHLHQDTYKDLHNLLIVKCPGCSYPWGNHGMCPNRTCLFCLTQFKWNEAKQVTKDDWDMYDYQPALVPKIAAKPAYTPNGTLVASSFKN